MHVACRVAAAMWPHGHRFQPQGPTEYDRGENLRGWLAVEAGYSETIEYDAETETDVERILAVLRPMRKLMMGNTGYVKVTRHGDKLLVTTPMSMATSEMSREEFQDCREKIYSVIEAETGIKVKDIKRNEHAHSEG